MFIDHAQIELQAGKGGAGSISFRREKFIPKGGPDGGNGGRGGNIVLIGDPNLRTLQDFRYKRKYIASNGYPGSSNSKTGKNGDDIKIRIPLGTIVKNLKNSEVVVDILQNGQSFVICHGGKGGKGNINFKSSTHQTPRYAQDGIEGEKGLFDFELKLLADVGLVGLPNAGKSTLLSVISKAKPKIADYPFTTLHPNLGIVKYDDFKSFVIADIPGIIDGASKGKGLGHQFLKHIERNRVLLFLIDSFDEKPDKTFTSLKKELLSYNKDLLLKPKILIRSKADIGSQINEEIWKSIPEYYGSISSVTHFGINNLILKISKILT
tara:strand:+ start:8076 stop:9044 length:969 start_codon:yes stop_codon:yes gene_type:complete